MSVSNDDRTRDSDGTFGKEYPDADILSVVSAVELATTDHIADELDCHPNTARGRLKEMADEGLVSAEKLRGAYLWKVSETE